MFEINVFFLLVSDKEDDEGVKVIIVGSGLD